MRLTILLVVLCVGCATSSGEVRQARDAEVDCRGRYEAELRRAQAFAMSFHMTLQREGECWDALEREHAANGASPRYVEGAKACLGWRRNSESLETSTRDADQIAAATAQTCVALGDRANGLAEERRQHAQAVADAFASVGQGFTAAAAIQAQPSNRPLNCTSRVVGDRISTDCN